MTEKEWKKLSRKEQEKLIDDYENWQIVNPFRNHPNGTIQDQRAFQNSEQERIEVEYANEKTRDDRDDRKI